MATDQPPDPTPDDLLRRLSKRPKTDSRYKLEGEVARGGMGSIIKIWDEDLRRHLAMKVVLGKGEGISAGTTPSVDSKQLARFLEEAQVTGQLDHPGIVPVHEVGLDSDGRVYFTMKLVKGRDLKHIFDLVFEGKEDWNETRALLVIQKVCEAMAYAHDKGVIHRDLKPANVMVGSFGEVYVMDWGLSRVLGRNDKHDIRIKPEFTSSIKSVKTERRDAREDTPDSPIVTMDGDVMGTPAYMSPEQARGEVEKLGPQSDVYSIGAMLYHLLARQMPYVPPGQKITNRTVLARVLDGPPKPLASLRREVPAELVAICERAMAREASTRYRDTIALAADLRAYMEQRVVGAYETGTWAETRKWIKRNKPLAASLLGGFAVLLSGLVTSLTLKRASERSEAEAKLSATQATASQHLAENARTEADARALDARWQAYVASIRAAEAAHRLGDTPSLRRYLEAAPPELRQWEWDYLRGLSDTSALTLSGHELGVAVCEFSPDCKRVMTGSWDGTARLWDATTGGMLAQLCGHADRVLSGSFSSSGDHVVTGSRDGIARLWNAHTGDSLAEFIGHTDGISACVFSPDGGRLLTGSWDRTARLWDLRDGSAFELNGHGKLIRSVAFSPDGNRLATASLDADVRIWDASNATLIRVLRGHTEAVSICLFSPDGTRLASASDDNTARIWDALTGLPALAPLQHDAHVRTCAFSPDGTRVLTGSDDGKARIWDVLTGSLIATLQGHKKDVRSCGFSPDGLLAITASDDTTARIWDAWTGTEVSVLKGHLGQVWRSRFSPSGEFAVTGSNDSTARIWRTPRFVDRQFGNDDAKSTGFCLPNKDMRNMVTFAHQGSAYVWDILRGARIARLPRAPGLTSWGIASPDGARLIIRTSDRRVSLWDTNIGAWVAIIRAAYLDETFCAFSSDSRRILIGREVQVGSASDDTNSPSSPLSIHEGPAAAQEVTASVLASQDGSLVSTLRGHSRSIVTCAFDATGDRILTGSFDRTARIWSSTNGALQHTLRGHGGTVRACAFMAAGSQVATGSDDAVVRLWDPARGTLLRSLRGHSGPISACQYSPDGKHIATASVDGTVRIWDTESGDERCVLRGHSDAIRTCAFSPDGQRIVTACGDATVRLWDVHSGTELLTLSGDGSRVVDCAFSQDGTSIWSRTLDGIARTWRRDSEAARENQRRQILEAAATVRPSLETILTRSSNLIEATRSMLEDRSFDHTSRLAALGFLAQRMDTMREKATALIQRLSINCILPDELTAAVRDEQSEPPEVRSEALWLANMIKDSFVLRKQRAREVVLLSGQSTERYKGALSILSVSSSRIWGEGRIHDSVSDDPMYGGALYRCGRFLEALKHLERFVQGPSDDPCLVALLAMTRFHLGDIEQAKIELERLRETMQGSSTSEVARSLLSEAEALIMPPSTSR